MTDNDMGKMTRFAMVGMVFTPSAPIDDRGLFSDRPELIMRCLSALFQKGMHVAMYGERGVGKTSIAKVLPQLIKDTELPTLDAVRIGCNTADTYETIWRTVFRDLGQPLADEHRVTPEDVRYYLQQLDRRTLIVLDEVDRVQDDTALSLLADTVKTLSDHAIAATLMFVGVARSLEHLIGEHASIVRNLTEVAVPRMSEKELHAILTNGFSKLGCEGEARGADYIVGLSEGLPHFVHLLAKHSTERVVADDRTLVTLADVEQALAEAVNTHVLLSEYQLATQSPQPGNLYEKVLLACAFAVRNDLGRFRPSDVRRPLTRIVGKEMDIPNFQRHLHEFSSDKRGRVLQRHGVERSYTFQFENPLMQPFTKIRALARGTISEELREQLQAEQGNRDLPTVSGWIPPSGSEQLF